MCRKKSWKSEKGKRREGMLGEARSVYLKAQLRTSIGPGEKMQTGRGGGK